MVWNGIKFGRSSGEGVAFGIFFHDGKIGWRMTGICVACCRWFSAVRRSNEQACACLVDSSCDVVRLYNGEYKISTVFLTRLPQVTADRSRSASLTGARLNGAATTARCCNNLRSTYG